MEPEEGRIVTLEFPPAKQAEAPIGCNLSATYCTVLYCGMCKLDLFIQCTVHTDVPETWVCLCVHVSIDLAPGNDEIREETQERFLTPGNPQEGQVILYKVSFLAVYVCVCVSVVGCVCCEREGAGLHHVSLSHCEDLFNLCQIFLLQISVDRGMPWEEAFNKATTLTGEDEGFYLSHKVCICMHTHTLAYSQTCQKFISLNRNAIWVPKTKCWGFNLSPWFNGVELFMPTL